MHFQPARQTGNEVVDDGVEGHEKTVDDGVDEHVSPPCVCVGEFE